jgi:alcohol dehydrogenase class IV
MSALTGRFAYPRTAEVRYGPGMLGALADLVDGRAFVIASRTLVAGGLDDRLRDILGDRLAGIHTGVAQHVPRTAVIEAADAARAAEAEVLISIGGGTPIDCTKGVALCLAAGIERAEQFDDHHIRFTYPDQLEVPVLPAAAPAHIAVPTTLSGGEHTNLFGITDLERSEKHLYTGPAFAARAVILDGELAQSTPADLWAASGVRAIDHAVEGTLTRRHMPLMDALGLESLRIICARLEESAQAGDQIDARSECLLAAWLAIYALTNVGTGLSHAIGHQLAAQFDMMHGVTSAVMLPHVLRFNSGAYGDRILRFAEPLGVPVDGVPLDEATAAVIDALAGVIANLERFGVPHTLSAAGATRPELQDVADRVLRDPGAAANPRQLDRDDLLGLFEAAW